jgi:hypothetical protein
VTYAISILHGIWSALTTRAGKREISVRFYPLSTVRRRRA